MPPDPGPDSDKKQRPSLLKRWQAGLTTLRNGGDERAWSRALFGVASDDENVRRKSFNLAKRLSEGSVSASEVRSFAYFQVLDWLIKVDKPSPDTLVEGDEKDRYKNAIFLNMWQTFEMALDAGMSANKKHQNNYWDTGLHRAAAAGSADAVKLLLKHGASMTSRCGNGYTPLACALNGWGEKKGSVQRRFDVAKILIEAGAPLNKGKLNSHYGDKDTVDAKPAQMEVSLLDVAGKMPELMIELAKGGAPTSWNIPNHHVEESSLVPGDNSVHYQHHVFFTMDSGMWDWSEKARLMEWLEFLREKNGDLSTLRSTRGFTPAMEMLTKLETLGIDRYSQLDEMKFIENVEELIEAGVLNLNDTTEAGSTIWHAMFSSPNERTVGITQALLNHYPGLIDFIDTPNKAGVRPWDILNHLRNDGGCEMLQTQTGEVKAKLPGYGSSWFESLESLISIISQRRLQDISAKVREKPSLAELDRHEDRRLTPKM